MTNKYNHNQNNSAALAGSIAAEMAEQRTDARRREHAARLTGAHTTMPIENYAMVRRWMEIAKAHDRNRNRGGVSWYLLLLLGFNTGLRIGDLCKLKVKDVRDRERIRIIAEKTDKLTDIKLQTAAQKAISAALKDMDGESWALQSRQANRKTREQKPISRQRCYAIVKEIARRSGFTEHVGCHTMRKTFAWNFYQTSGDLAKLQKVLNHSSQEATIHYLGLDQKAIDQTIDEMKTIV